MRSTAEQCNAFVEDKEIRKALCEKGRDRKELAHRMTALLDDPRGGGVESVVVAWGEVDNGEEELVGLLWVVGGSGACGEMRLKGADGGGDLGVVDEVGFRVGGRGASFASPYCLGLVRLPADSWASFSSSVTSDPGIEQLVNGVFDTVYIRELLTMTISSPRPSKKTLSDVGVAGADFPSRALREYVTLSTCSTREPSTVPR